MAEEDADEGGGDAAGVYAGEDYTGRIGAGYTD